MKWISKCLVLLLLGNPLSQAVYAQHSHSFVEDTIYVAANQTAMLIFESDVSLVDLGTGDYQAKKVGNKVLLRPTIHSPQIASLLITYGQDQIFSGFVAYSPLAAKPVYDYRQSITQPSLNRSNFSEAAISSPSFRKDPVISQKDLAEKMAWSKAEIDQRKSYSKVKSGDVYGYAKPLSYDTALTYISCLLENKGPIPFKVDYVGVKIFEPSAKKGLGNIEVESKILAKVIPSMINRFDQAFALLAIPTFATTEKGWTEIHITEKQGTRSLVIKIRHRKRLSFNQIVNLSWLRK